MSLTFYRAGAQFPGHLVLATILAIVLIGCASDRIPENTYSTYGTLYCSSDFIEDSNRLSKALNPGDLPDPAKVNPVIDEYERKYKDRKCEAAGGTIDANNRVKLARERIASVNELGNGVDEMRISQFCESQTDTIATIVAGRDKGEPKPDDLLLALPKETRGLLSYVSTFAYAHPEVGATAITRLTYGICVTKEGHYGKAGDLEILKAEAERCDKAFKKNDANVKKCMDDKTASIIAAAKSK